MYISGYQHWYLCPSRLHTCISQGYKDMPLQKQIQINQEIIVSNLNLSSVKTIFFFISKETTLKVETVITLLKIGLVPGQHVSTKLILNMQLATGAIYVHLKIVLGCGQWTKLEHWESSKILCLGIQSALGNAAVTQASACVCSAWKHGCNVWPQANKSWWEVYTLK